MVKYLKAACINLIMKPGRPLGSPIRQNLIELLGAMGSGYGYEIYKAYIEIFPKVTMRSIYHHLKKGTLIEEFKVNKIVKEKGDFSWGPEAEKIYYGLGPNAKAKGNPLVSEYFKKKKK
jgi:hypothetical protein